MNICQHKYKEIILTNEINAAFLINGHGEKTVRTDKIQEFYLYCENCGNIIKLEKKEK